MAVPYDENHPAHPEFKGYGIVYYDDDDIPGASTPKPVNVHVKIFDGNNSYRRRLESDETGMVHANFYRDIQNDTADVVIVVWDGENHNERRRKIFPDYKGKRAVPSEDIRTGMALMKEIVRMSRAVQIEIPEWEADDVIASICYYQRESKVGLIVETNDRDYCQLLQQWNVRTPWVNGRGVEPHLTRLYKSWVGDPSDNVCGVKGFGEKAWESAPKDELKRLLNPKEPLGECPWLNEKSRTWLEEGGNRKILADMYRIVGFIRVPQDLIKTHSQQGKPAPETVRRLLDSLYLS